MISLLLATCLANVTYVPLAPGDPDAWATPDGKIFIGEQFKDDERLKWHEVGHCVDFLSSGNPQKGLSPYSHGHRVVAVDDPSASFYAISWKDTTTKKSEKGFVSKYARTNCFEDWADSFAAFKMGDPFPASARKKLVWMRKHL